MQTNDKLYKMHELLETSKLLNSSKDTGEILNLLLKKSLELIDGADAGMIFLYNDKSGILEVQAYEGLSDSIRQFKLLPGESIGGMTFRDKRTYLLSNSKDIRKAMSTISDENLSVLKKSVENTVNTLDIYGGIACPLMHKQECIGVIMMDNFYNKAPLTQADADILESISVQATIAIINAQNYEKELKNNAIMEKNNAMMEKYSQMLEVERNRLEYSSNLHSKFTEMVLSGCDISDIITEISSRLDRDVFMVDLFNNIDYYSLIRYENIESIIGSHEERLANLLGSKQTTYFNPDTNLYLYISPIIVNKEVMGWLCTAAKDDEYSELDNITIERGIMMLALELLKINDLNNMEQSLKGDFLDNLILNQDREYLQKYAKNYKFSLDGKHYMIMLELKADSNMENGISDDLGMKRYARYYYGMISREAKRTMPDFISIIKGNNVIVIVESKDNIKKDIKEVLDKVVNTVKLRRRKNRDNVRVVGGVSDSIENVEDFKSAYFSTQQLVKMLDNSNVDNGYLFYDELEVKKLLLNSGREELEKFLSKTLGALIEYRGDSKEYFNTLKVYIQSDRNWTYTKNHLNIHGNTLSYRIRRMKEILNLDLDDYEERLKIQIALSIYEIFYG